MTQIPTRAEFAADMIAAIESLDEVRQIRLTFDIEDAYPNELPEWTEDDAADIAAVREWGARA